MIPKSILSLSAEFSGDESHWKLELQSKPTEKFPIVLLVDGLFLLLLGLVIIVLHLKEKADDQKENN